jgi:hypothetical protein
VNIISKAGVAHVMEESMLQTVMVVVVDIAVPTRKWPRGDLRDQLSANLNLRDHIENNREERHASKMQRR